jgi:hypothetical protein
MMIPSIGRQWLRAATTAISTGVRRRKILTAGEADVTMENHRRARERERAMAEEKKEREKTVWLRFFCYREELIAMSHVRRRRERERA